MNFYLPDFCDRFNLNPCFIELLEKEPEKFYDGVKIKAVYGTFPGAIWNGGRLCYGVMRRKKMEEIIAYYNNKGVSLRYTWTNCLLEEKHFQDTYCNLIMEVGNNGKNDVIINNSKLEEYLRANYKGYHYISSTSKCITDLEAFNKELEKDYELVVLDYRKNADDEFLNGIKDKKRVEIVVNEICSPNCQVRTEHFIEHSRMQLNYESLDDWTWECKSGAVDFFNSFKNETFVKLEDMKRLQDMGFENFKIQGRFGHPAEVLENYVYYMVKPEYRDEIRLRVLLDIWQVY